MHCFLRILFYTCGSGPRQGLLKVIVIDGRRTKGEHSSKYFPACFLIVSACTSTCCMPCEGYLTSSCTEWWSKSPNILGWVNLPAKYAFAHARRFVLFAGFVFRAARFFFFFSWVFVCFNSRNPQTPLEGFQEHRDPCCSRLRRAGGVRRHGSRRRFSQQGELRCSRAWTRTLMRQDCCRPVVASAAVLYESGMPGTVLNPHRPKKFWKPVVISRAGSRPAGDAILARSKTAQP